MHQLPAHAARTSRRGTATYRTDGLVIVGVHTPEFAFEHVASNVARGDQAARHPLSGRPGQRVRDLERLLEPVLAGGVPDRPQRPRPRRPLRRGRLRRRPRAAIRTLLVGARRRRCRGARLADTTPDRADDAGVLPRLRAARRATPARRSRRAGSATYTLADVAPRERARLRRALDGRATSGSSPARTRGSRSTSTRRTSTSSSAARAASGARRRQARADGDVDAYRLYTLRSSDRPTQTARSSSASRPGVQAYAFTFG